MRFYSERTSWLNKEMMGTFFKYNFEVFCVQILKYFLYLSEYFYFIVSYSTTFIDSF